MSELSCNKINPAPQRGVYQGAFLGNSASSQDIEDFSRMSGTPVDISLNFSAFSYGLDFPAFEAGAIAARGGTIFIKLEPMTPPTRKSDRSFSLQDILDGKHDQLLANFAAGAKRFGRPLFVSFAHEMNGNWYPWSGNPELYVKAYRYVHDKISKEYGACNITWVWNPNIIEGAGDFTPYYPGDDYVDWVAVDGYNWDGNRTAASLLGNDIDRLKAYRKPIMIGEFGCAADSASCLSDFVDYVSNPANQIRAFIYFNEDKEKKWAVSTPEEKAAYREAILRHQALFSGSVLSSGSASAPATAPAVKAAAPFASQPDLRIGRMLNDGSAPYFNGKLAESGVTIEQMEIALKAIASRPVSQVLSGQEKWKNLEEYNRLYPELWTIYDLDQRSEYKLYWYFFDPRAYWDNAISLINAYAQKCQEQNRRENLTLALEMIQTFRARISGQQQADRSLPANQTYCPNVYQQILLDLTEAEIRSQVQDRGEAFYREGITIATRGISNMFSLQHQGRYRSRPDYFSLTKTVVVMGDLYQQLGQLTNREHLRSQYFSQASYFYGRAAALEPQAGISQGTGLKLSLAVDTIRRSEIEKLGLAPDTLNYVLANLFDNPDKTVLNPVTSLEAARQFLSRSFDERKLSAAQAEKLESILIPVFIEVNASPREIEESPLHGLKTGQIEPQDRYKAEAGIFYYLKGSALIKQTGLFAAWPKSKSPIEVLSRLRDLKRGMELIEQSKQMLLQIKQSELASADPKKAAKEMRAFVSEQDKKARFMSSLGRLMEGEMLLLLADRINYYSIREGDSRESAKEKRDLWEKTSLFASTIEGEFKDRPYYWEIQNLGTLDFEARKNIADNLFSAVQKHYISDIPANFKYLSSWSKVKLLEIMVRDAIFVLKVKNSRIADASTALSFVAANLGLLESISSNRRMPEYLKIEFDYLCTILLLAGVPNKDASGKPAVEKDSSGGDVVKRATYPDQVMKLVESIETSLPYLPAASRTYFETYTSLKEVGALMQAQDRKPEENAKILKRIEHKIQTHPHQSSERVKKIKQSLPLAKTKKEVAHVMAEYALLILEDIEQRTASPLPTYLLYNIKNTLSQRIAQGAFNPARKKSVWEIVNMANLFVENKVKNYYPQAYPAVKAKIIALSEQLRKRDAAASQRALGELLSSLDSLNAAPEFSRKYGDRMVWDLKSLYSELYHQFAVTYSVISKTGANGKKQGDMIYQYIQSAYMNCALSTSPYDHLHRPFFIYEGSKNNIRPDTDIPLLRQINSLINK